MPGHDYKTPGIIRAAFQYQDLVAIETLIDYYRKRDLYEWVQLDADDQGFRSVDDVVACRPDGRYELTQVKFTPDPRATRNTLSWAWLTRKLPHGTSLLQKWAETTLRHESSGTLATAALKTDRVPSLHFAKSLNGSRVEYGTLPARTKAIVDRQLGSSTAAARFFGCFDFRHSQPRIDDLEEILWSRVASDTDRGGWSIFRDQVRRWSTRKRQPSPDGKIRYVHLRQAFSVERSRPLPQDFQVPPSYSVPDDQFAHDFLNEITGSDGITVLWGPPGRGKSTYLSKCIADIDKDTALCIRHHYFLHVHDHSEGRFHYHAIVHSLIHQIESSVPNLDRQNNELILAIENAAHALGNQERRLIIVIDGLDHVWRDHRDHNEMEELFAALLPLPRNVRLVVGTQKVANQHLPATLLRALPTDRWTELPLMSEAAVGRWLRHQEAAGRLNLRVDGSSTNAHLMQTVATALREVSGGLPLHLIYSFEALVGSGAPVDMEAVKALPACPTGDIRDYYRSFWERVSPKARAILHVLAGLKFGPPPFATPRCFGDDSGDLAALDEVSHLLDYTEVEIQPFHTSLFAFIRELPDHGHRFREHSSAVLEWLQEDAPGFWKWAWLWITAAQRGDSSDLLSGPSREWAIKALVAGYPIEQIVSILDHAESAALEAFDLPRLLRWRRLKIRALNGPEFHTHEWARFLEVAVSHSPDPYAAEILRGRPTRLPGGSWPFVVRTAPEETQLGLVQEAIDQLNRQLRGDGPSNGLRANQQHQAAEDIVAVLGSATTGNTDRVVQFAKKTTTADDLLAKYAHAAILSHRFNNVLSAGEMWSGPRFDRYLLTALCLEGLAPAARPALKGVKHPAIRCFGILRGATSAAPTSTELDLSPLFVDSDYVRTESIEATRSAVYDVFFSVLAEELSGNAVRETVKIPLDAHTTWLGGAVHALERLAAGIARNWRAARQWPTLTDIYSTLEIVPPAVVSRQAQSFFIAVRLGVLDVAVDLCTIAIGLDAKRRIKASDIESVIKAPLWLDELWLGAVIEHRLPVHTSAAAAAFIERVTKYLETTVIETSERADIATKLALFANDNGLPKDTTRQLRRAAECVLGYGSHKDLFAWDVLESLDLLAEHGQHSAREAMLHLAGAFAAITAYTDGDETGTVQEDFYKAIIRHYPERAPACYSHLIEQEDWSAAQVVAEEVTSSTRLETPTGRALFDTYILPSEVRAVSDAPTQSRHHLATALETVLRRIGKARRTEDASQDSVHATPVVRESGESASGRTETSTRDPGAFPPGRLQEYLGVAKRSKAHAFPSDSTAKWLEYWNSAGMAEQALDDLAALFSNKQSRAYLRSALDAAFEISRVAQGRSSAFAWLVRAHIEDSGWEEWFGDREQARARCRAVAQYYPERWREFLTSTAQSRFETGSDRNGITVGMSRLVYFLLQVGEEEIARKYAVEMARILKDEVAEQPIEVPPWAR